MLGHSVTVTNYARGACILATEWHPKGGAQSLQEAVVALYRYQCVSVGWWRGKIKRWNTTFHWANPGFQDDLRVKMNAMGWKNPGDVEGACSGGVASIAVYDAAGGPPISNTVYFDWQDPSSWIPFNSGGWVGVDPTTPLDASGESALVIVGHLPGLSSSGKPMSTRKYFHAIPSRTEPDYAVPDVSAASATALAQAWQLADFRSPTGVAPLSLEVELWYLNHQRTRGRRRTVTQVAAQSFTAGVVAGAASGGGQAAQFQ